VPANDWVGLGAMPHRQVNFDVSVYLQAYHGFKLRDDPTGLLAIVDFFSEDDFSSRFRQQADRVN
jgi:hypothetical protein